MQNNSEQLQKAYEKAIKLIKIRPHGSGELIKKLTMRRFNAQTAAEVTEKLKEQGLINDEQFLEDFVDSLIRFKTFGFYGILAKLLTRGVLKSTAESFLKEKLPINVEREIALKVKERERGLEQVKLAQKLSRKGFRSEVISQVIRDDQD